jgi:cellobiose phosphorylase
METQPQPDTLKPAPEPALHTAEQMAEHARLLAVEHDAVIQQGPNRLLQRLDENERLLSEYNRATYAADRARRITPASEWILDNFYMIEEQIQMARRHFPRRYSRELPRLVAGRSAGLPRVYDIVLGFVSRVDTQLDVASIGAFLNAYQVVTPLKLGELWAIPIMLRLALIENLRRITDRLNVNRHDRDLADRWAQRLEATAESQPSQVVVAVADMAREGLSLSSSFVAEFHQRLSRSSAAVPLARGWLDQRLAENGLTVEQLVRTETQSQAADQVSVSHTISGLRLLATWDWRGFVESVSAVERVLETDPSDAYRQMDFSTRDSYRHAVEAVARYGALAETVVASKAVRLAEEGAREHGRGDRSAHVGFYLVGPGRAGLEQGIRLRLPLRTALESAIRRFPVTYYMGSVIVLTALASAAALAEGRALAMPTRTLAILSPFLVLCCSQLAVAVVNWFSGIFTGPRLLPRLDYSGGLPPEARTMVVVPTLVPDAVGVARLLETIEIHFLANRDPNLHFALLTDFPDAGEETLPEDADLRQRLRDGIAGLNERYGQSGSVFYLFHRSRRWNPSERRWMGYERKRGKIADLNALLRGGGSEAFSDVVGDASVLARVRYVITLDTDTQLPPNAARTLAATMSHPLNRPRFDADRGVVVEGYTILQPRVSVTLHGAGRSWFSRLFSGDAGIDPYTRAVSDVYQDVFQEGSFIGKGIYDVDAFERAVGGRFPENTVLSHDLLESCYARSGLVTDVELYEEFPSRYIVDARRRHRWIRGDWQIALWLLPRVPGGASGRLDNPLSPLSRWKIFDNLRRSLVPPALLILLLGMWVLTPALAGSATLLVLTIVAVPALLSALYDVARKPEGMPLGVHVGSLGASMGRQFGQVLLIFAFLPYEACLAADAILRTLWRVLVSRRSLLEWTSAAEAGRRSKHRLGNVYAAMASAPLLGLAAALFLFVWKAHTLLVAGPLLALWCGSPWIAWRISKPITAAPSPLSRSQALFLRSVARRTWHFFEAFVTADDHFLPPDNFQEQPVRRVASRTSPTNMGLSLLANLAARDFGYISVAALLQRTSDALKTMEGLQRYKGHFYNWYDTRTLQVLVPHYVSTVDSGNLAGHLLVLAAGIRELASREVLPGSVFAGMCDTCAILRGYWRGNADLDSLCRLLSEEVPGNIRERFALLKRTGDLASRLGSAQPGVVATWAKRLQDGCTAEIADVLALAPWLEAPGEAPAPAEPQQGGPTLRELAEPSWHLAGANAARGRLKVIDDLESRCTALAQMDFTFLFDPGRKLFSVGFNVDDRRRDSSFYDLLASEARLASFVAVAQGQVGQDHWFALGRLLVSGHGEPVLASWSGSMFEYLMPALVMPLYENTLLAETCRGAVERQIEYGRQRRVPWGISESGYNLTDAQLNYQYKAFGVPGLGLKRGLAEDLVVSPYSCMMAVLVDPRAACENLERLTSEKRTGMYGFYESVDYTPTRVPQGQSGATVSSYMVHHQGMGLLGLACELLERPMQRRFGACPTFKSADLLLQERVPHAMAKILSKELEVQEARKLMEREAEGSIRTFAEPASQPPEVHLLSNGRYHLVVSQYGGGYSRWRDVTLNRWREDSTRDPWGVFLYLRDTATGEYWSAAPQPVMHAAKRQEAIFSLGRAEFRHHHLGLDVHTEITVSPEDDVEVRRVTLRNPGHTRRTVELTGYFEVVLAPAAAEAAHPAFNGLFVQTEFNPAQSAVLCTRRPRSHDEKPPWLFAVLPPPAAGETGAVSCETDRSIFLGRGNSAAAPAALRRPGDLTNSCGPVLDPVVALRRSAVVPAGGEVQLCLVIGAAETRQQAEAMMDKFQAPAVAARAFELAWTHNQVMLRQLNASEAQAQLYARLGSALVYARQSRRANSVALQANRRSQDGLWRYGISGDLPLVIAVISDASKVDFVRQLVQAHAYWSARGLSADLVILNGDDSIYRQPLHEEIVSAITTGPETNVLGKPGGIFSLKIAEIPPADRALLQATARIALMAEAGSLAEQLDSAVAKPAVAAALRPTRAPMREMPPQAPARDLLFHNGLGGFTRDGREYVIALAPGQVTPAPWVNVIANAGFGTVVSESGASYTWAENCHEYRLTPWSDDPVVDPPGEAYYVRDEETGQFWSPTPMPARGATGYAIRHGFGYTVFEHAENGIATELTVYVATDAPVKFAACKVRNLSSRPRRISVTGYWEWVLGEMRTRTLLHVQTEIDGPTGALLARNRFHADFADRIAFADTSDPARTVSGDRLEFIGRNGSLARPAALLRTRLSGRVGAGLDPAGALQVTLDMAPGQEAEASFRIGAGRSLPEIQGLVRRFRAPGAQRAALEQAWEYWGRTLGAVNVDTPDPGINVLANGWLLYQTLCCRILARSGFYQSGGAYGFRDQLQDVMALVHAEPALTREHILRAAGRQFREGDVQHWWHPPLGRGVRTRVSDDYLWLPYVACRYSSCTADTGVWDEKVTFVEGRRLNDGEESVYDLPSISEDKVTLYEHCLMAVDNGLKFGAHGLPLMGSGDWNDGMNLVGEKGRGESVWLAFFLYDVLRTFAEVAASRGDAAVAARLGASAQTLRASIEREAWDGEWYRRAYFDDGTPLGSSSNAECQVDSLPQSWSVISGAGSPERSLAALRSVQERLVSPQQKLIRLFDPPFDHSALVPGYIKGYIPGVRENGGQYTHAALWVVMACAQCGQHDRAWELFQLISPVRHSATHDEAMTYKVEPYVVAADVYDVAPHKGRGGWSWYTGSAGWMYRTLVETLLGVNLAGGTLALSPRLPRGWTAMKVHYRYYQTVYHISFARWAGDPRSLPTPKLDGQAQAAQSIPLVNDRAEHFVEASFL